MAARNVLTGEMEFVNLVVDHDVDIDGERNHELRRFGDDYFVIATNVRPHSFTTVADFERRYFVEYVQDIPPELLQEGQLMRYTRNLYPVKEVRKYDNVQVDAPSYLKDLYLQYKLIKPIFDRTIQAYKECTRIVWNDDVVIEKGQHKGKGGFVYQDPHSKRYKADAHTQRLIEVVDITTGETYKVKPDQCRVLLPLKKLTGQAACMDCRTECLFCDLRWIIKWNRPICFKCFDYYSETEALDMREDNVNIQGPFCYDDKLADSLDQSDLR